MSKKNDILKLEQEKKQIEDKLRQYDGKAERLDQILAKKKLHQISPENQTLTKFHNPVSAYLIPQSSIKSQPKPHPVKPDSEPIFTNNETITTLRYKSLLSKKSKEISKIKKAAENMMIQATKLRVAMKKPPAKIPESMLPHRYTRGELPCTIEHGANGQFLSWMAPFESLDYDYYLPLFFDGLQCKDHPHCFLARQGAADLIYATKGSPQRILSCLKDIIQPLRNALLLHDADVTLAVMKIIQQLIRVNHIGEALLPYGRQFLVPLASFLDKTKNLGDGIDYGQRKRDDVGEEVRKTLELLEETGGSNALAYIKFSIPTYESCLRRPDIHHRRSESTSLPPAVFSQIPRTRGKLWH